jgi:Rad52/22 family double-strand break repair protein
MRVVGERHETLPYVDARFVYDRLDLVCGEQWSARFGPLPRMLIPRLRADDAGPPPLYVRCRMTLFGVTREDVGEGTDPKAAVSDAANRAAVHFGVGRVLYALRAPWLRAGDADGELRPDGPGGLVLDERTEGWCREKYERWIEDRGSAEFGERLAHGNAPDPGGTGPREPEDACQATGEGGDAPSLRAA